MTATCERCGGSYAAQRSTSRYCSPKCKQAARRARRATEAASVVEVEFLGPVAKATRRELEAAGALDTASGQCALVLAKLVDAAGPGNGAAVSSWVKELRACEGAALAAAAEKSGPDFLDQIRERARRKREGLSPVPS